MNSRENSIKKVLLNDITTNKKTLVDYEINSWLQTNQKHQKIRRNLIRPIVNRKNYSVAQSLGDLGKVIESLDQSSVERSEVFIKQKTPNPNNHQIEVNLMAMPKAQVTNNEKRRNSVFQLKEMKINTIENRPIKSRSRCNSKGYVLKEIRRKLKQQNQLKHFSQNKLSERSQLQNIENINIQDSISFVQKRYRIIPVMPSRKASRNIVI